MYTKVFWKCFIIVSICFLMCPKRVRTQDTKLPVKHKQFPENVSSPAPDKLALNKKKKLKFDGNLGVHEPGFDFNKEEMAKLKIWPQGVVPYYIDDLSFDKGFRDKLQSFLESVSGTGIHFVELSKPPKDQSRWVFFINRRGDLECADYTTDDFTNNGVQRVIIGYDCLDRERALAGTVLALAGVPPQHNAPDRDKYVQVNIENVLPDKQNLFKSLQNNEWLFHELEYDYNSAGHFDWLKYSANGKATIKPKLQQKLNEDIANNRAFTLTDLQKLRMLYNFICKKPKEGSSKNAECNQLYVRGTNFGNYGSDGEENTKPRIKPNKYLGISDNVKDSADQDNDVLKNSKKVKKNEGNVENDEKVSFEIQNDKEKNDIEQDASVEDSIKEIKVDNVNNQTKYGNESLEGIEATNEKDGSKDVSKEDVDDDIDAGQDHNKINNENLIKDNAGEDSANNDVTLSYNQKRLKIIYKKKKLNHPESIPTKITQSALFDVSDFNTQERWQKLKVEAAYT